MATKAPNHHITYDDKFKADLFIDAADLKKAERGDKSLQNIISNYAHAALAKANPEFAGKYTSVTWKFLRYERIDGSTQAPELVMPKQHARHAATR